MIYSNDALAKHRLKGSYEALSDAEMLMQNGSTAGSLEMSLCAAKEAAQAALLAVLDESIRQESIMFLVLKFVRENRLSANSFKAFRTMMDLCQYVRERDFSIIGQNELSAAIENLKHFIREMDDIIRR